MKYEGKLYVRIAHKYIDCDKIIDDKENPLKQLAIATKRIKELEERESYLVSFVNDIGELLDMDMSIYGSDGVTWELEDFMKAIYNQQ
jgi:hypothetical protein